MVLALTTALAAGPAVAGAQGTPPASPSERTRIFAVCAGRFSALAEHQRLFDGPASETSDALRQTFVSLLDAVLPDALAWGMPGDLPLTWRIEAKAATADMLATATFGTWPQARDKARTAAEARLAECRALIPGA